MRALVPAESWETLHNDLAAMQLLVFDHASGTVSAVRDYDQVILDLEQRGQRSPMAAVPGCPGRGLVSSGRSGGGSQRPGTAGGGPSAERSVPPYLAGESAVLRTTVAGVQQPFGLARPMPAHDPQSRRREYFRQQVQPYLGDLRWIADWGAVLPPFCDASWQPDLLQIIERLLNTPRYDVAMTCIEYLFQEPANVEAILQATTNFGILIGTRWEELAFLLLAFAPQQAMPVLGRGFGTFEVSGATAVSGSCGRGMVPSPAPQTPARFALAQPQGSICAFCSPCPVVRTLKRQRRPVTRLSG